MIDFECVSCHKKYTVSEKYAGKKTKCSKCNAVLTIPQHQDSHGNSSTLNDSAILCELCLKTIHKGEPRGIFKGKTVCLECKEVYSRKESTIKGNKTKSESGTASYPELMKSTEIKNDFIDSFIDQLCAETNTESPLAGDYEICSNETKECPFCGEEILLIAEKCKHCKEFLSSDSIYVQTSEYPTDFIERIATYEKISAVLWLIIAIIQILLVIPIIAGVWNLFASFTRFNMVKKIRTADPNVPSAYEGVGQLIIIGLINLFFGAVIGVVFVALDFYIRDQILKNKRFFTGKSFKVSSIDSSAEMSLSFVAIVLIIILLPIGLYAFGGRYLNEIFQYASATENDSYYNSSPDLEQLNREVIDDFVEQYKITKRNGTAVDAYVMAEQVAAACLQAQDEDEYVKWKNIARQEARKAGIPVE